MFGDAFESALCKSNKSRPFFRWYRALSLVQQVLRVYFKISLYKSLFKQSRLESYFASGVAGDTFVLAVEFDLVVVQLVFARENGIDDLLAGDVLYLSA